MNIFTKNLKELRAKAGITQQELADDLKVSKGLIYHWESGRCSPGPEMLITLADYFKVTVDNLLGVPGEREMAFRQSLSELNLEKYKELSAGDKKFVSEQFNALIDKFSNK